MILSLYMLCTLLSFKHEVIQCFIKLNTVLVSLMHLTGFLNFGDWVIGTWRQKIIVVSRKLILFDVMMLKCIYLIK